jgi:Rieske Fe-S protein
MAPGEAKVVVFDGNKIALYEDDGGSLHALKSTCTHMGCDVAWNSAEHSWDCPCHGARFAAGGDVLTGPAVEGLEKITIE